jgi:hypothetical protein
VSDPRTGDESRVEASSEVGLRSIRVARLAARLAPDAVLELLLNGGEIVRPAAAWRLD